MVQGSDGQREVLAGLHPGHPGKVGCRSQMMFWTGLTGRCFGEFRLVGLAGSRAWIVGLAKEFALPSLVATMQHCSLHMAAMLVAILRLGIAKFHVSNFGCVPFDAQSASA